MNVSQLPPSLSEALGHCSPETLLNLSCHSQSGTAGDGESQLVCAPPPGDRSAMLLVLLIGLTVLIVLMILTVNMLTMLTLYRTRKLHTLMNYLVAFICLANLPLCISTGLTPYLINHRVQTLCYLRYLAMTLAHNAVFVTVVAITVLRYMIVVRNKNFTPTRRNVALALVVPLLVAIARCLPVFDDMYGKCGDMFGRTTEGFVIVVNRPAKMSTSMLIGVGFQYTVGLLLMAVCHARILAKAVNSQRRVRAHHGDWHRQFFPSSLTRMMRPGGGVQGQHRLTQNTPTAQKETKPPSTSGVDVNGGGDSGDGSVVISVNGGTQTTAWWRRTNSVRHGSLSQVLACGGRALPGVELVDSAAAAPAAAAVTSGAGGIETRISWKRLNGNSSNSADCAVTGRLTAVPSTSTAIPGPSTSTAVVCPSTSTAIPGPSTSSGTNTNTNTISGTCTNISSGRSSVSPLALRPDRLPKNGGGWGWGGRQPGAAPAEHRRVDVVATAALLCCMAVYVLAYAPFVAFILAERQLSCLLMPSLRLLSWTLLSCSVGLTAVLNPLIFVIFNSEFRRAFRRTCCTELRL